MSVHFPEVNFGSILEDNDSNMWFGTRSEGAYQYNGTSWTRHDVGDDVRPEIVDSDGRIWAISDASGVYVYDSETWIQYGSKDGLTSDAVFGAIQAQDGSYWFATDRGVSHYKP